MSVLRDLRHPESHTFTTLNSIKNALSVMYRDTSDERYESIRRNLKLISDVLKGPTKGYAIHEEATLHGYNLTLPIPVICSFYM